MANISTVLACFDPQWPILKIEVACFDRLYFACRVISPRKREWCGATRIPGSETQDRDLGR
jgi:hypothetical protein